MKYNLAIAACFRDELPYIVEWIEYHLLIGVEHFYLSNNDFNKDLANIALQHYVDRGLVTIIPNYDLVIPQHSGFYELYHLSRNECKWLALLDIDEFIYPQKFSLNIYKDIIQHYEEIVISAIGLNWCVYGTGNHVFKQQLVTQSYLKRADKNDTCNKSIKLIIRPESEVVEYKGHSFTFKNKVVNTLKVELPATERFRYNTTNIVWQYLRLNHYPLKSLEEFLAKTRRGNMGKCGQWENNKFWSEYFANYNKNSNKDVGMLAYGDLLRSKLCTI